MSGREGAEGPLLDSSHGPGDTASGRVRILQVTEALGAGVLSAVQHVSNVLPPDRFDVTLLYSRRHETPSEGELRGLFNPHVRLLEVPGGRKIDPWSDLRALRAYIRIFRERQPDIVHLHSSKAGFLGRIAAKIAGVPRVYYSPQGLSFLSLDISPLHRQAFYILEWIGGKTGGVVLAASDSEAEALRGVIRRDRVRVVENAVDLEQIQQTLRCGRKVRVPQSVSETPGGDRLGELPETGVVNAAAGPHAGPDGNGSLVVGTVGRMAPQKDPRAFLEVAKLVSEGLGDTVRFLWIGDGERREAFELLCGSLGLDGCVTVTGWLDQDVVWTRLGREVDVYLQTSLWEGMPFSLLEAMALEKPIVARAVVGSVDVVEPGRTGFLGETPEELAAYCEALLTDPDRRRAMGAAGRDRAERRYSLAGLRSDILKAYGCEANGSGDGATPP